MRFKIIHSHSHSDDAVTSCSQWQRSKRTLTIASFVAMKSQRGEKKSPVQLVD